MRQEITTDEHNRKEQMKTQAETQKKEQHETSRQFAQLARSVGGVEQAEFWQREKVKNLDRATRGQRAVGNRLEDEAPAEALIYLLTDLYHWADAVGVDWDEAIDWASSHHAEEVVISAPNEGPEADPE